MTGLLTPPNDPAALAQNIAELVRDPARRAGLAAAGECRVRSLFAMDRGIDTLARRFGLNPSVPLSRLPLDLSPPLHHVAPLDADTAMLEAGAGVVGARQIERALKIGQLPASLRPYYS